MSILKKLFGSAEEQQTPDIAPAAPITAAGPTLVKRQIPRHVRIPLTELHRIHFRIENPPGELPKLSLANISIGGMAVMHGADPRLPNLLSVDGNIDGVLTIDATEIKILARIRHVSRFLAGCEFTSQNPPSLRKAVENYLRVEICALSLRKVDEAYLTPDPRGKVIWFTDGRQNEIYGVVDKDGLVAFHMSFLGNYVEGERGKRARTGVVSYDDRDEKHKGSSLLDMNEGFREQMASLALTFVRNIEQMHEDLKREIEAFIAA